jgi:hypothetical protein
MKTPIAVACGLLVLATLTPLYSAKPLALEAPDPANGIIGVRVKVVPPAKIGSSYSNAVYFVRVVEDADRYRADSLIDSNYTDGRDVYLLNAKPGRYVAIGCRLAGHPAPAGAAVPVAPGFSVGVAFSPGPATVMFSKADILLTEVEVRPGAVVFMGVIETHSSTKTRESDEAQAHYLRIISPEAANQGSMARAFSGNLVYIATFKSIERGEAATAKFWDESIETHFVNERAWASLIARGSSVPAGVAAGVSSAGATTAGTRGTTNTIASEDEFLSAVCVNANATKARAYGQPKEAEEIARQVCQKVMTDWDSQGCGENPDQDPCKKRLVSLDGSLRSSGSSMLFAAAQAGQTSICSAMLAMGSDPNAAISTGKTPVMIAAESGYPEIVELLTKVLKDAPSKGDSGAAPVAADPPER